MSENIADGSNEADAMLNAADLKRKRQSSVDTPDRGRDCIIPRRMYSCEPVVSFHIGKELRQTPQSSFLSYIWGSGLDSDCMLCGGPFHADSGPPIRTIGLEQGDISRPSVIDITQEPVSPWGLRIFNRHLVCIKANRVSYVPISHAWHEDVATAQDLHLESIDVSKLVYQTPVRTLLALVAKFPDSEIWHDYLSVPQWCADVQGQLLLAIPEIYNHAEMTVIHLDDVAAIHLSGQINNLSYDKFINNFSSTIRSRWFDRMWVTLEYIQSNDVLILTEDYTICDTNARDLCHGLDTAHSKWVRKHGNSDVTQDIWKQNTTLKRMVSWTDMESWKNEHDKHQTLGWAIGILGHRQCRYTRDYLLALGKMLNFQPEQDLLVLVENPFQYFFSLSIHALERGDYTPLFFITPLGEQSDLRAPWLRGYSTVSWKLWDMGRCHRKATNQQIIRNGKIQPRLETVGIIEWFEHYDFRGDAESVMDYIASKTVRANRRDAKSLSEAVDRIFPQDERKAINMESKDVGQEDASDSTQRYNLAKLQLLLEEYGPLLDRRVEQAGVSRRLELAKKMSTALKLSNKGKYARESRLESAVGEAEWFLREYERAMEGIGRVSCKICGRRSIFRLTMWEEPTLDLAQVYRIPGLLYDDTIPEGVGIVVEGKRIIGKMMYGTPACDCSRLELVELGLVKF